MTTTDVEAMAPPEASPTAYLRPLALTAIALAVGLAFEVLFFGHPLGINFPLWATLSVAALLGAAVWQGVSPSWQGLPLAIPLLFFAWMAWLRAEPLTLVVNVVFTLALFTIWVRAFRDERLIRFGWVDFAVALAWVPLEAWLRPWGALGESWRRLGGERGTRGRGLAILRGLLLAIPILLVFVALLSSADLVFGDLVEQSLKWFQLERLPEWIGRGLVIAFATVFSLGSLVIASAPVEERVLIGEEKPLVKPFLGFTEAAVVLGAVDLTFLVFVVIQLTYLFGGEANITATGYTYSEYARRGFGELVAVGVLSLGMIMGLAAVTRREVKGETRWFNGLSAALVGLVGLILLSALRRLLLYENAYGFTRLRTYTHIAIPWMGVLFASFLGLLLIDRLRRFAPAVAAGALGFAATLNLINVDPFILRQNVARYEEDGEVDAAYLAGLSDDAVPALVEYVDGAPAAVREVLLPQLACRRAWLAERENRTGWQSGHRARAVAAMALEALDDELDAYPVKPSEGRGRWTVTVGDEEQICRFDAGP